MSACRVSHKGMTALQLWLLPAAACPALSGFVTLTINSTLSEQVTCMLHSSHRRAYSSKLINVCSVAETVDML